MNLHAGRLSIGHPVDVATGILYHTFQDYLVPGRVPLVFKRRYSTGLLSQPAGMFGAGWSSPFEMRLRRDLDGYRLVGEDGETEIDFDDESDLVASGGTVRNLGRFSELRQEQDSVIATCWNPDNNEVVLYHFTRGQDGAWWPLDSSQSVAGQGIQISRDQNGRIITLRQQREGRALEMTYDHGGRVIEVHLVTHLRQRRLLSYSYDRLGRLSDMTDAVGNARHYEYDTFGRMSRELTLGGMEFRFRYDAEGRCVEASGRDGFDRQQLEFNSEARLTRVTDPIGFVSSYQWNQNGQIETETSPLGHTRLRVYDNYGRIIRTVTPGGAVTTYDFDALGNRITITSPSGAVTRHEYDKHHRPISLTDPRGHKWQWTFGAADDPVKWVDPLDKEWTYDYSDRGDLIAVTDPLNFRRVFSYDEYGNLTSASDRLGHLTTYEYNDGGRITAMVDPLGGRTEAEYDTLDRIRMIRNPDTTSRSFSWNEYDQIANYVDERGGQTRWKYTKCGLLRKIIRAEGSEIIFTYTRVPGQLATMIDEQGAQYSYEYDADGRTVTTTDFSGRLTSYSYDADGHISTVVNAAGHRTQLRRDSSGAVLTVECDDGSAITYKYDQSGNLTDADNGECVVSREYDASGRLILERQGQHSVTSTYDAAGNRTARRSSEGSDTIFQWDGNRQVKSIGATGLDPIVFEYDPRHCEVGRFVPGGIRVNQSFDERGRQVRQWTGRGINSSESSVGASGAEAVRRHYRYDSAGNLAEVLDARWGTTRHSYDLLGRVISSSQPNILTEDFVYDRSDNLTRIDRRAGAPALPDGSAEDGIRTWEYGAGNQLLKRDNVSYEYNRLGQLIGKTDEGGPTIYEWNRFGQMVTATLPNGEQWHYRYDSFSRRIEKRGPSQQTGFVWDGDVVLHELRSRPDSAPEVIDWEFDPLGFAPIAKTRGAERFIFINDIAGTPCEMTTTTGEVTWAAKFTTYGGEWANVRTSDDCPVRFQGQWCDLETGLHYNRFRYYDADLGRYISPDVLEIAGGRNAYSYAPNPFVWVDPLGLVKVETAPDFDTARRMAFERAGMTDPSLVTPVKFDESGTAVEFKGPGGAKVAYDGPHADMDPTTGHDLPHVGWQTAGKKKSGGAEKGNITYDGPPGPARSDCKP